MDTTTNPPATPSGDGSNGAPSVSRPEAAERPEAEREVSHLLSADGSPIPIERGADQSSAKGEKGTRKGASKPRPQAMKAILDEGPPGLAIAAFAIGVLAGALVGVLWARR
jgi:hypothetical protein